MIVESKLSTRPKGPTKRGLDGQQELWRPLESALLSVHKQARRQRGGRHDQKAICLSRNRVRQNAGEMVMQGAALVIRIVGAMIVLTVSVIIVVSVMVMDMIGGASGGDIFSNIQLARENMLQV